MHKTIPFRSDAIDKVTGAAQYSADFPMAGMLHAKVLWPPVPSARIIKIDTSEAEKAPGLVRIITRKDITGPNLSGMYFVYDRPILVGEGEVVRFIGDALALVVARTEDEASRARDLIRVEYEEIPTPYDVDQALAMGREPAGIQERNKGDIDEGFAQAAVIQEESYDIPYYEHAHIEPEAGYAYIENNGTIAVCVGTQDITQNHRMACRALDLPFSKVRLYSPYVGGGFGGKHSMSIQPYLVLMGHILQKPVRLVWTREESLSYGCKRQRVFAKARMGLDQEGRISAFKVDIDMPVGAYFGNYEGAMGSVIAGLFGGYRFSNVQVKGRMFKTGTSEIGSFRGVGTPDGSFIVETMIDKCAHALGIDPLTVRSRNWMQENEEFAGQIEGAFSRNVSEKWLAKETMDAALEAAGPLAPARPGKKVGRGLANAAPAFAVGNSDLHKGSSAELLMFLDGTLVVKIGFPEIGEGISGVATSLAAHVMGIPEDRVNVIFGDSHKVPRAGALGFSQATVTGGNAVLDAGEKLKAHLAQIAREYLKSDDESIYFRNHAFFDGSGKQVLDWDTFSDYCYNDVRTLSATGCVVGPPEDWNLYGVTTVATVADVEVDEETGDVHILQLITAHDIGKAINWESARGQIVGAASMSAGMFLMEEFIMDQGRVVTPSFSEYLLPTSLDMPGKNEAVFLEGNLGLGCPLGAKGVGEHGMHGTAAAIANAIYQATGALHTSLPVTPEKVLKSLGKI